MLPIDAVAPPIAVAPAARWAFEARARLRHHEPRLALDAARRAWSEGARDERTALPAARAAALLGDAGDAVMWLQRAVDAGWREVRTLERDGALSSLRARADFGALVSRVRADDERISREDDAELRRLRDDDEGRAAALRRGALALGHSGRNRA